jgi:hypothetical protein
MAAGLLKELLYLNRLSKPCNSNFFAGLFTGLRRMDVTYNLADNLDHF